MANVKRCTICRSLFICNMSFYYGFVCKSCKKCVCSDCLIDNNTGSERLKKCDIKIIRRGTK